MSLYVPHQWLDQLAAQADEARRKRRDEPHEVRHRFVCEHPQYWSWSTRSGKHYRKCVTCNRYERLENGAWVRAAVPRKMNEKEYTR